MKLLILSILFSLPAFSTITCTHPQICNLFSGSESLDYPLRKNMDPHHFEPTLKEIKTLMQANLLIIGPHSLNPWASKIAKKRVDSKFTTYSLKTPKEFLTKYNTDNTEALAHFWVYPDILCHFKKEMKKKSLPASECSEEQLSKKTKNLSELIAGKKIVITHDALSPLFTFHGAQVLALVSSEHGHRPDLTTYKKLADWQKANEKLIWILEKDIKTNKNILKKIGDGDIQIKIDITGQINQDSFFIWDSLVKELKSSLYAK